MPTFVYQEFHFICDICGVNTIGRNVAGSNYHGWDTRRKAQAGLKAHRKECLASPAAPTNEEK